MTVTHPALRAVFGNTPYYITIMKISELVSVLQFPDEIKEWKDYTLREKFQRNLDIKRIENQIAPYFANDPKRFSGSLVVAVNLPNSEKIHFESVGEVTKEKISRAFSNSINDLGFVIFEDYKLIPIDGQHRAKAFEIVLGWSKENNEIKLQNDQITLLMVDFDKYSSRYIFSKINQYAKPTTKATKLITDDDDSMAILTRDMVEGGIIPKRLVNIESNSLNKKSHEFTLLSTLYDANVELLQALKVPYQGKPKDMSKSERISKQKEIELEWKRLLTGIKKWENCLKDVGEKGDEERRKLRKESILGIPIGQLSIVKGYAYAYASLKPNGNKDELVKKLDKINWDINDIMWRGLLVKPNGTVMYGKRISRLASRFITHLIGGKITKTDTKKILTFIHGNKSKRTRLPTPISL